MTRTENADDRAAEDIGQSDRFRIAFVSSNLGWGGSEILWTEAALRLVDSGHHIAIFKNRVPLREGAVARLRQRAKAVVELAILPVLPGRISYLLEAVQPRASRAMQTMRLYYLLKWRHRPDLVVISQGGNYDGFAIASVCRRLNLPYVLISQKATELYWPPGRWLNHIREAHVSAHHSYFVSEHNLRLTEEQIGQRLDNASVVRNPFLVPYEAAQPWPAANDPLRLACVGRLYPKEKGQDILLRVLAQPKWRERSLTLTFFGEGDGLESLERMAKLLGVDNVRFVGQVGDIPEIWRDHHLLVLPSRAEGLPLVVVEAMLSGRVPVVPDVAGNREVVADGETGFVAAAPTEAAFDEALERAWQNREHLPQMGQRAAARIRELVPADPSQVFADALIEVVQDLSANSAGRRG